MLNLTPILKLYARYRNSQLAAQRPADIQERVLLQLLKKGAATHFGKDHAFASITSVAQYQERVPLRKYEELWESYWKNAFPNLLGITWPEPFKYFAVSSGTTSGKTKYIPVTPSMIRSNTKAGVDLLVHHVTNRPRSNILAGKSFILSGSTSVETYSNGIAGADLSGIAALTMPYWAKARTFPPAKLALSKTWEERIKVYGEQSLKEDIRSLNGAPSWMLIFLDQLKKLRPQCGGKISEIYPNLEMFVHGGMSFAPYRKVFMDLLEGSQAELREVYPSSEGFVAVQDRGEGEGMRMLLDHAIFYEFVPIDDLQAATPKRFWIKNIEKDVVYAIVLTTCAGLWSYLIGDTVRFVDIDPPRLLFAGRTSYMMSAVGEHLIGEEIEESLVDAATEQNLELREFSVGAIFPNSSSDLAQHHYIIEFATQGASSRQIEELGKKLDAKLIARNEDYEAHRRAGYGLHAPKLTVVLPGTFALWMKSRGKFGGQNKIPRVINDGELFAELLSFCSKKIL